MSALYNRVLFTILYDYQDEILSTSFNMGTVGEDLNGPWDLAALDSALEWVDTTIADYLSDFFPAEVEFRCVEVFPVHDEKMRSKTFINKNVGQYSTPGALPPNCTSNVTFRGARGAKFVHGGMRISGGPMAESIQGVWDTAFITDFNDVVPDRLLAGFTPTNVDSLYVPGIFGSNIAEPFVKADAIYLNPVLGSMRERTGNRPQRRRRPATP